MTSGSETPAGRAVTWLTDEACTDPTVAGGKGASLAAMAAAGLPVPPAFVILADVLEESVDAERLRVLARAQDHAEAQKLVRQSRFPRDEIVSAYERLDHSGRLPPAVAVRSSARAEDSEAASYAGLQETYLDVVGGDVVCRRVVDCWASFFSERALFYRASKGSLDDLGMAVVVQKMVASAKSGVIFTVHPVSRRRDRMIIEAVYGLGEQVVSGEVTPDHYVVDRKGTVKLEHLVHGRVLDERELQALSDLGCRLEEHFGSPQDVEWAIADDQIYLLQSRPVTTV
jgi:pyruvate,water dikinase